MRANIVGVCRFCLTQAGENYECRTRQAWRIRSFGGYTPRGFLMERRRLVARKVGKWMHSHELRAFASGAGQ